jgi:hypothetical protein
LPPTIVSASMKFDPDCKIVQALAYVLGPRSGDPILLVPCRGPVRPITVRGAQPHANMAGWIPTAGPIATFSLCQAHRKAPSIRESTAAP